MSDLDESLSRVSDALARKSEPPPASRGPGEFGTAMGVLAIVLIVAAVSTGNKALLALALVLAAAGGIAFVARNAGASVRKLVGEGGVGIGATVEEGALVEPGATVEMGATVARGAKVLKGARVRMGATIGSDAVVNPGAIVSWGAVVERGATVGEAAIVGAGSTVQGGAQVPAGMRINPGVTFGGRNLGTRTNFGSVEPDPSAGAVVTCPQIPRATAVCDRLEQELRESPEHVRAFLGTSQETIASLRRTCDDLARREQAMREGAGSSRLDEERTALQEKLATETDPHLKSSLEGAVAAIDELKRQRELLRVGADRLEAEQSRLVYTLEGLASQFVRLRTAGPGAAPAELQQSLAQLRDRIDAIADAIEQVSREAPAAMRELASAPPDSETAAVRRERAR
ncbi:MAG: hypothetical protein ABR567_15645 [Myxococcales bacterium]